jgi:hypothetical protein
MPFEFRFSSYFLQEQAACKVKLIRSFVETLRLFGSEFASEHDFESVCSHGQVSAKIDLIQIVVNITVGAVAHSYLRTGVGIVKRDGLHYLNRAGRMKYDSSGRSSQPELHGDLALEVVIRVVKIIFSIRANSVIGLEKQTVRVGHLVIRQTRVVHCSSGGWLSCCPCCCRCTCRCSCCICSWCCRRRYGRCCSSCLKL